MKTYLLYRISIVLLFTLVLVGAGIIFTQGSPVTASSFQSTFEANFPWEKQYVQQDLETPLDVGKYISLALRPYDDAPVMSYYDATNGNLMVAISAGGGAGNCGTDNDWFCYPIDGTGSDEDVGRSSSIDIWGTEEDWRWGISYYDANWHGVKAVFYACSFDICMPPHIVIIAYPVTWTGFILGQYTSIKFNSGGVASIAYYAYNPMGGDWLTYAYPVASGGNCGGGDDSYLWQCDIIDSGDQLGQYASLDFSWDDRPYIAYYDGTGGNLKLAHFTGSGNCGPADTWQCDLIDGADGSDVGKYASLIAPQSSGAATRIAYYDQTNHHLKYYSSAGLNMIVDEMGSSIEPMGISMTGDNDNRPVIAYQKIEPVFFRRVLRLARLYYVYHLPHGNCGETPPGYSIQIWQCDTLDYGGLHTHEADFTSVKVDSNGRVRIAYTEDALEELATSLKIIYQTNFHVFMPLATKQ